MRRARLVRGAEGRSGMPPGDLDTGLAAATAQRGQPDGKVVMGQQ